MDDSLPYLKTTLARWFWLLSLLVWCVLFAVIAELVELKAFLQLLLILVRVVIHLLAHGALEVDEIVLRHRIDYETKRENKQFNMIVPSEAK